MPSPTALPTKTALILDGSLGVGCVALLTIDVPVVGSVRRAGATEVRDQFLPRIAQLLPDAASREGLVAVIVGVGPGSYTGIRAAASAAAGVATALRLPIIQIRSDRALYAASTAAGFSAPVVIPLGTREVLVVDASGSRLTARDAAPASADLALVAANLPDAFAALAAASLAEALAAGPQARSVPAEEITLHYSAVPRGTEGAAP